MVAVITSHEEEAFDAVVNAGEAILQQRSPIADDIWSNAQAKLEAALAELTGFTIVPRLEEDGTARLEEDATARLEE